MTTATLAPAPSLREIAWALFKGHPIDVNMSMELQRTLSEIDGREIRVHRNLREVSLEDWAEIRVCRRGHPQVGSNVYVWRGRPECRECVRFRHRRNRPGRLSR